MPLFVGDFLASTGTWDCEEAGLYLLLLCYEWSSGPLPNDVKKLAKIVKTSTRTFNKLWKVVGAKFTEFDGRLVNIKLEEHREKNLRIQASRSHAASIAAIAKWDASRTASGTPSGTASVMPSTPIYSESKSKSKNKKKTKNILAAAPPAWFEDFKHVYPQRAGDPRWRAALQAANARISAGATPEELIAGAQRYATFCNATGKTGSEFVKQAASFLGPDKAYALPWHPPPEAETAMQKILRANSPDTSRVIEHDANDKND